MGQQISFAALLVLLAAVLALPVPIAAQGCSMCRDTAAGSAPQVRKSLRRAIPILAIPATALFLAMLVVAFGFRQETDVATSRPARNDPSLLP